jgi:hypothetical protein
MDNKCNPSTRFDEWFEDYLKRHSGELDDFVINLRLNTSPMFTSFTICNLVKSAMWDAWCMADSERSKNAK